MIGLLRESAFHRLILQRPNTFIIRVRRYCNNRERIRTSTARFGISLRFEYFNRVSDERLCTYIQRVLHKYE